MIVQKKDSASKSATYPKRKAPFAIKYIRALLASPAVCEAGLEAVFLTLCIVDREDRLFYSKAPRFWESELLSKLDVKEKAFRRIRQRAIDAGILFYDRGNRQLASRYWALAPEWLEPDGARDPLTVTGDRLPDSITVTGDRLRNPITVTGDREPDREPDRYSKPSTYDLIPKKKRDSANPVFSKNGNGKFDPSTVELPAGLDGERFKTAWLEWIAHRREIKQPLKPTMTTAMLKKLAAIGEDRAVAAIDNTIANGWQGIREPETNGNGNGAERRAVEMQSIRDQLAQR